jgi:hypothetical protein
VTFVDGVDNCGVENELMGEVLSLSATPDFDGLAGTDSNCRKTQGGFS